MTDFDVIVAALAASGPWAALSVWARCKLQDKVLRLEADNEHLKQLLFAEREQRERLADCFSELTSRIEPNDDQPPVYPPPVHEEYPPIGRNPRNYR